jgi:integrase
MPLAKSPHYLIRNPHSYCFRLNVPLDLQKLVGRRELRYTLRTGCVSVARAKARSIAAHVQQIFACLRRGRRGMTELSDERIRELIQQNLREYIDGLESRYYEYDESSPLQTRGDIPSYIQMLGFMKDDIIEYLAIGDYHTVEERVYSLLEKNGVDGVEKGSKTYIKLCREMLRADMEACDKEKAHLSGDFSMTLGSSYREQPPSSIPKPPAEKGDLISEVIEKFASEAKINWRDKTRDENLAILRMFMKVVGDVSIRSITRQKVGEFKQTLSKLPPNVNKNPKFRRKTIQELIRMEVPKRMSGTTIGKYLTRVGALFDYARKNGLYDGENPAIGMNPPEDRRAHEKRAPFTREELIKLFHSEDYLGDRHNKPHQYWMPLLALFTGARLNELAQLHISDIRQAEDGVWIFDLNEEGEKQLKAKSSRRIIPIHPFLLNDLNFLSWVEQLKAKRQQRLFPELRKERDGYGRSVSRWFNDSYRKKCGISSADGRKRDFHSFRATFITQLVYQKVNPMMRLQVEGHSPGKDMTSVYADPFPAKQLFDEVISKLDYGLDLSHLKNSRFVIKKSY